MTAPKIKMVTGLYSNAIFCHSGSAGDHQPASKMYLKCINCGPDAYPQDHPPETQPQTDMQSSWIGIGMGSSWRDTAPHHTLFIDEIVL